MSERRAFGSDDEDSIVVTGSRIPATRLEPGEVSTQVQVWIDYAMVAR